MCGDWRRIRVWHSACTFVTWRYSYISYHTVHAAWENVTSWHSSFTFNCYVNALWLCIVSVYIPPTHFYAYAWWTTTNWCVTCIPHAYLCRDSFLCVTLRTWLMAIRCIFVHVCVTYLCISVSWLVRDCIFVSCLVRDCIFVSWPVRDCIFVLCIFVHICVAYLCIFESCLIRDCIFVVWLVFAHMWVVTRSCVGHRVSIRVTANGSRVPWCICIYVRIYT